MSKTQDKDTRQAVETPGARRRRYPWRRPIEPSWKHGRCIMLHAPDLRLFFIFIFFLFLFFFLFWARHGLDGFCVSSFFITLPPWKRLVYYSFSHQAPGTRHKAHTTHPTHPDAPQHKHTTHTHDTHARPPDTHTHTHTTSAAPASSTRLRQTSARLDAGSALFLPGSVNQIASPISQSRSRSRSRSQARPPFIPSDPSNLARLDDLQKIPK